MYRPLTSLVAVVALALAVFAALAPAASADDHDLLGVSVTIDNTIESQAFDFAEETPFGSQGPVEIDAGIEFAACCDGFYETDLSANQVLMRWIGPDDFERVIEDGTFDRYYFAFSEPVLGGATINPAATMGEVSVTSATTMTVVIGPGSELNDDATVLIDIALAEPAADELAFTGAETSRLAVAGAAAVVGGAGMVAWSRRARRELDELVETV